MCGILGIISPACSEKDLEQKGEIARACLVHRGPDQQAVLHGEGWLLSHHRLAIFDVSAAGKQPMTRAPFHLVFNGAIYNFPELKQELAGLGHQFNTETDTEVILAAYQQWGTDCFSRFNGMWALAILDTKRKEVILSRDRFGIKPMYLYQDDQQLIFASEPRAIRAIVPATRRLNRGVAHDFLRNGWQDHRPDSLWKGIAQFPAASFRTYRLRDLQQIEEAQYYQSPLPPTSENIDQGWQENLRSLFLDSVHLRTRSNVGFGLTLSGGIDSSSIAGAIAQSETSRPATYSALFPNTEIDESPYVKAVIDQSGLPNHPFFPSWEQFAEDGDQCAIHQDQPLASCAVVSHFGLIRQLHSKGEKVLLNGQGADEIGAGYDKFAMALLKEQWRKQPVRAIKTGIQLITTRSLSWQKVLQRFRGRNAGVPETVWSPKQLPKNDDLFQRSPESDVYTTSLNLLNSVGLPSLLRHEDRNTMAFGLESRTPFLDYRMVDYLLQMPAAIKLRYGIRKYAFREVLSPFLPRIVKERSRKLGFATPQQQWMTEHQDYFLSTLRTYVKLPDAYLTDAAVSWSQAVLNERQYHHFPQVWRLWAWAHFRLTVRP